MIISALVLLVAPWIAGCPTTAEDAHRNELGGGVVVLLVAAARFIWYPGKWPDPVVLLADAWMIASPWALRLRKTAVSDGTQVLEVAVGIPLMVPAGLSLLMPVLPERRGTRP